MGIVVVGFTAVSTGTLDEVEATSALADLSDEFFVESAGDWWGSRGHWRRGVDAGAVAVKKGITFDALAAERVDVVGGVGFAGVTLVTDEIVAKVADASAILVDFVGAANWGSAEGNAFVSSHVVAEDADALAENVVIDLQVGAVDFNWVGSLGFGKVSISEVGLNLGDLGGVSLATAVYVLVGLAAYRVDVVTGGKTHPQKHREEKQFH